MYIIKEVCEWQKQERVKDVIPVWIYQSLLRRVCLKSRVIHTEDTIVQCLTSYRSHEYLTQGDTTNAFNNIIGLVILNIFTEEGIGAGANYTIGKRLRDLYNRVTVSNVIFDSPIGPEVLTSSPEGKFQTQIRITFNIYEDL